MTAEHAHSHDHAAPPPVERHCDVAVIGGSAAGLAGALQIARQRRTVIVVDDGTPRNAPAAHMHGYLGREGAAPSELVAVGREEVRSYGGEVLTGRALAVRAGDDGRFRVELSGGHTLLARRVLAATGIVDELPDIEGLAPRWGQDVIHCPFCHGYEVRDQRLVQIVTHPMGLHPSPLLRHLTDRLTVVLHDVDGLDDHAEAALSGLEGAGVPVVRTAVRRVTTGPDGAVTGVELADGSTLEADSVLVGTRFHARLGALASLGLEATPHASGMGDVLEVDPMTGQTAVPGVYAAGNVTDPSLQVLPSAAHGSRIGAMISFSLADEDVRAQQRPSGEEGDWDHRYAGEARMWSGNPNGTLVAQVTGMPPGRALDVGAGEGGDVLWLAEQGWEVTASDISGNALGHVGAAAQARGLPVTLLRTDANAPGAFDGRTYDLVSLQYGSFLRTPEGRGLGNLLGAVAPGGTLLVVSHDLTPLREPVDPAEQTRMWDPEAYVGVEEIATALAAQDGWTVELHQTRPRPAGAASTHHVDDVVLRAVRTG
ncbi:FAD-dependent oxidoreductase [Serinicoccus kebangsaanensis]|uniref:FAD-dependent oxidoreductase n=1 Tax=Serinicoccus kebangsaanensis TaxID=2602069 RepID=UPI00124EE6CA|nr:FAD-dependent oxidoreductase [Serinicoccus kebangsaanensis]